MVLLLNFQLEILLIIMLTVADALFDLPNLRNGTKEHSLKI